MLVLYYLLIAGMILLCTVGTALLFGLLYPRPWVTMTVGPWVAATFFFTVESIVPLGRPGVLLGALLSTLSGWLLLEAMGQIRYLERILSLNRLTLWKDSYAIWDNEAAPYSKYRFRLSKIKPFGWIILVLIGTFTYMAVWRYPFPDVDGSSEKLPDLMYITSYLAGTGVPSKDLWCPPYSNVQYYSFQHYAAALMGRAFGLSPGETYNFAICLLMALVATTGIGAISIFGGRLWIKLLCTAALLFGGMGVSGIVHFMVRDVALWNNIRFVGCLKGDMAPLGTWFNAYTAEFPPLQLPAEPFSYSIYLGDYHPPLAGLYLLFVALLVLGEYHLGEARQRHLLLGLAAATVPWSLVGNMWTMPLQAMLVGSWAFFQACRRSLDRKDIAALLIGGGGTLMLLLGYLSKFIPATAGYNTALKLVPHGEHTPTLLFLLFLFPIVATIMAGIASRRGPVIWVALFWLAILVFTEMFYVDDLYSGEYDRFNTTLKWWPWIDAGIVCSLAPLVLNYGKRYWLKALVCFAIGYPCFFAWDLAHYWWTCPKINFGIVTGDSYLLDDRATRSLYTHLKVLPLGVTIERPEGEAFTNTTAISLMTEKPSWLGWLGHEQLWRNYPPEVQQRFDKITHFYDGTSSDVEWLWANHIKYILWYKAQDDEKSRLKLDPLLAGHYTWVETFRTDDGRSTGYWALND
jgi:uncharacterized membrane protein